MPTLATVLALLAAAPNTDIPYFARRYSVTCGHCHVAPPKLNAAGEAFVARGYDLPGRESRGTWPFALWVSGRSDALPGVDPMRTYLNRIELISGGQVVAPWLSYFVEWRPLSLETRGNGSLRDRSGRFEDLFVVASGSRVEATVGQFRLISQVDVSRRIGIAEPVVLSTSLAGDPAATARLTSLRAFAPSGRSPAARVGVNASAGAAWRWTTSVAVPLPGELSLPLTDSARVEASNELEWRAKGVMVESFARKGLYSIGAHVFYDRSNRYLAHALATGNTGDVYWTAIAGFARAPGNLTPRGRWSLEAEYLPTRWPGGGARIEELANDRRDPAVILYLNAHLPGTSYTVRLTVEQKVQPGRHATVFELGTVF